MSNYRRGYAFELQLKRRLEEAGWFVVRSAGSHGACDLIALKEGLCYLIQAKVNCHIDGHTTRDLINLQKSLSLLQPVAVYARKSRRGIELVNLNTHREVKV